MPYFCGMLIHAVKLFASLDSSKMFYAANFFLPFALLAAMTFLPFFVFILDLNPCVLFFGVVCG